MMKKLATLRFAAIFVAGFVRGVRRAQKEAKLSDASGARDITPAGSKPARKSPRKKPSARMVRSAAR